MSVRPVAVGVAFLGVVLAGGMARPAGDPPVPVVSIDNQVHPKTGTIAVRGVFANSRPAHGVALLSPGMSVRVQLPIGVPYEALAMPDRAVVVDWGQAFVFVVNARDALERRPVQLGPPPDGALRVVWAAVMAEDLVVLSASPGLKEGQPVQPKKTPVTQDAPKAPPSGQGQA